MCVSSLLIGMAVYLLQVNKDPAGVDDKETGFQGQRATNGIFGMG